jgi:LacI family transcriptional regulator
MLVYPRTHHELDAVRRLRLSGLPVVLLAGGADCGLDVVGTDERRGAYKAVAHLVELGHRRIAMIDCSMRHGNAGKRSGYRQALAEAGIAFDPVLELVPDGHTVGHGCRSCARLLALSDRPTALFTSTDSIALGALRACQLAGVSVPGDLAICGFDNIEYGEYATTPLSSVNYSVGTIARRAVGRLLELIDGGDPLPEPIATMIDPALIKRESTLGPS